VACREELCWEREFGARSAVVDRLQRLEAAIGDMLSNALVVRKPNRIDQPVWPWMNGLLP